ncbi:MAG: hypothetical protein RBU45_09620 [Myxococcota bacterium]|jgi:hypothetical protein|nr:hypothetical protein [Myxococcota bacterium]
MEQQHFAVVFLVGRPAAGKSLVRSALSSVPLRERRGRFHLGEIASLDELSDLLDARQTDELLAERGKPRLFTDRDGLLLDPALWDLFALKSNARALALLARDPALFDQTTLLISLARGGLTGYGHALTLFADELRQRAVVLGLRVSREEAQRRNRARAAGLDGPTPPALPEALLQYDFAIDQLATLPAATRELPLEDGSTLPCALLDVEQEETDLHPERLRHSLSQACRDLWERRPEIATEVEG